MAIAQTKNPRRVAAGRENQKKWQGHTPEGLERLRQAALEHQPWLHSTGPKTAQGKARVAANGKLRQKGPQSVREARAELMELRGLLEDLRAARQFVT